MTKKQIIEKWVALLVPSKDITLINAYKKYLTEDLNSLSLPPAEGAEAISKITNSPIGSVHWYRSIVSKIKDIGEFLSTETPKEEYLRVWGRELFDGSLELLKIENNPKLQQQPTAEGAEEILEKHWNNFSINVKKAALKAMQEFATLHAQRIADKMVEERLREELIKYDQYYWGGNSERDVDAYLKNRKK